MLKKMLIVVSFGLLTTASQASELAQEISQCVKIKDSLVRLVCYDKAAKSDLNGTAVANSPIKKTKKKAVKVTKTEVETIAPVDVTTKTSPAAASIEDSFGQEHIRKKQHNAEELEQIVLVVASLKKDTYKKWIITFENGQVWKQKDSVGLSLASGNQVELSKGALGVVYLKRVGNSSRRIKVKRVK